MNSPRGSIWRKWDLHIHTPASFHWNGGKQFRDMNGEEKDLALDEIVRKINQSDVAAFAVMDYWTFDGYCAVRERIERTGQGFNKTIFPGMELRIDAPVDYRLNIHVVLSDLLTSQELQDFKGALKLGISDRPLSDASLVAFARGLDTDVARHYGFSVEDLQDERKLLQLGSKTAKITRESLKEALKAIPEKTCLVILPYDTSDGLKDLDWAAHPYDDSYFMQSAHIFETRDPDNIDLFLHRETERNRHFIGNFITTMGGRPKPPVSGSDAHRVSDYGVYPSERITWIKADPTFRGLLQLVNEPRERIFIGAVPPKLALVQQKKTKYVDSVEIKRKPDARISEVWFNNAVPFNTDLIAIIGNKGKGKSALTDIIGLLANTKQHNEFTFLSTKNFCQLKENKARNFQARLTWASGVQTTKGLDEPVDEQQPEMVKYIPQNFLETICTQLGGIEETEFDHELKKVIFSHVDYASRLGKASLDELISYKTTEANDQLQILRQEMHKINEGIVALEVKSSPSYRLGIENLLRVKREELTTHESSKPEAVQQPANDPQKQAEISLAAENLADAKRALEELEKQIASAVGEEAKQAQSMSVADKLLTRIENLERQVQNFSSQSADEFRAIGLSIGDVLSVTIKKEVLVEKKRTFADLLKAAQEQQDPAKADSPAQKKTSVKSRIEQLQASLDEPNKLYDAYTTALKTWEKQKEEIQGAEDDPETIRYFEAQLRSLADVPRLLSTSKVSRMMKATEIHAIIRQLAQTYRELYSPVNQFIETRSLAREKFQLNFEVGVVDTGFVDSFFEFVSHGVSGTFCGVEEGNKKLKEILAGQEFNTEQGVEAFLREIIDSLENDKRPGGGPTAIDSLMRTRKTTLELYDFVFGLSFLKPRYALRMGDKELNQLSPGERGTLLLVFYLLVDKDDIPLVIDQPEENLDNQTVYDLLVPCFKEAKQRRQIFIVTHNPNLAVVCDAEQIVWADLDKKNNYVMRYFTGAIESEILNKATVDVLEGTMPAFDNRESKYFE